MRHGRSLVGAAALALLALVLPDAVAGQVTFEDQTALVRAQKRAEEHHARALGLHSDPRRLTEAARLHHMSARLRPEHDTARTHCLAEAAHLYFYAGRRAQSRRLLEQAAEITLRRGDVRTAAQRYLDAAVVAIEDSDARSARRLAQQAQLLATSPLLSATQRSEILDRVTRSVTTALRETP